jgi:hypothetical protein
MFAVWAEPAFLIDFSRQCKLMDLMWLDCVLI